MTPATAVLMACLPFSKAVAPKNMLYSVIIWKRYGNSKREAVPSVLSHLQRSLYHHGGSAQGRQCGLVSERRGFAPRSQGVSGSQAADVQDPRRPAKAEEGEVVLACGHR